MNEKELQRLDHLAAHYELEAADKTHTPSTREHAEMLAYVARQKQLAAMAAMGMVLGILVPREDA